MPIPPSPTELLTNTLLWLGVPFMALLPISLALWAADWLRTMNHARGTARRLGQHGTSIWNGLGAQPLVRLAVYVGLQGALIALVYSSFRLAHAMSVLDSEGRNIADGKTFSFTELWMNLTTYSTSPSLPLEAFWLTVGWLIALNVAHLIRSGPLTFIVELLVLPVVAVCTLGAIGIGVVGLMVLSLATWLNDPGYNVGMVSLYAFWVLLLGGIALTLRACVTEAERTFGK